jgi:hypothetical protein
MLVKECFNKVVKGALTTEKMIIPPSKVIAARTAYTMENTPK